MRVLQNKCMVICGAVFCLLLFTGIKNHDAIAGELNLSWDPPTTNTDGSVLTDLAGYKLYYGTSPAVYGYILDVGIAKTYALSNLAEGKTYYCAITAYDVGGNESDFSNEVRKTILALPLGNADLSSIGSEGRVDGYDLIALEMAMGSTPDNSNWNPLADFDSNGVIDDTDRSFLIRNFGLIK